MKRLRVLKFGGSSVGTPEKIRNVAAIILAQKAECQNIVVVVSAMGDTTDDLLELARQVSPLAQSSKYRRELDMLLSAGERISMSLLSMALCDLGLKCRSFTGSQSGIITDTSHGEARIHEIRAFRIEEALAHQEIVIVAGFQGVSKEKEITTLGRGGSDTTAVALGMALKAEEAFIYTDVAGFMSADPRNVAEAFVHKEFDSTLAYLAASRGAQVLHPRCIEIAAKHTLSLWVKNTFNATATGTCIKEMEMNKIEGPLVKAISQQKNLLLFKFKAPSTRVLKVLFDAGMRPQDTQWCAGEISFLLQDSQSAEAKSLLQIFQVSTEACSSLSLTGFGFESHPELLGELSEYFPAESLLGMRSNPVCISFVLDSKMPLENLIKQLHAKYLTHSS